MISRRGAALQFHEGNASSLGDHRPGGRGRAIPLNTRTGSRSGKTTSKCCRARRRSGPYQFVSHQRPVFCGSKHMSQRIRVTLTKTYDEQQVKKDRIVCRQIEVHHGRPCILLTSLIIFTKVSQRIPTIPVEGLSISIPMEDQYRHDRCAVQS